MTHKVIFDTDPGIDDAMALLFAAAAPGIELLGVTTVLGNGDIDRVTRNALYLCERFAIDVPVHRGAAAPLLVDAGSPPTFVHGDDALGNLHAPAPQRPAAELSAAQFIVDRVMAQPGEITLVAVGRLTNLALALAIEPRLAGAVKQVVVMGGALGYGEHRGNVSPCAEANIHGDPHAADRVMTAGWPLTLVGLDVTMHCVMRDDRMTRIREAGGDRGAFIWDISRHYDRFYREQRRFDGFPVHDSCAIAWLLDPSLFDGQLGAIRVVTEGIAIGQTVQAPAGSHFPAAAWQDVPPSLGCLGVDSERLLSLYEEILCRP